MAGYESRILPQAAQVAPAPNAEAFGAGFGRQLAQAGDEAHRRELRAYQLDRQQVADQETSDFAHRFALHRQNMDGIVEQLRTNPTRPDYGEHVQQAEQADQAARDGLLSGITEEGVRRRAEQQLDEYRVRLAGQESEFAAGQRVAKVRSDAQQTQDLAANRVRRVGDAQTWTGELGDWYGYVDGLQGLTPAQKQNLAREGEQRLTIAYIGHLNDTNPAGALQLLDKGVFDEFLGPEQVEQLRNGSEVEIRRADAAAEHAANVQKAAAREEISTLKEKASQGIDVSGQIPQAIAAAQAMGDTSTAAELQGLARDSEFARTWGAMPPLAREQRLLALKGKPAGQRSENEQAELKWLTDKKGSLDSQFNNDPVAFAAASAPDGMAPPAIADWSPAELQARETWMRKAVGAYGSMKPLSGAEAQALGEQAQTDKGYREVLGSLHAGFSGRTAMQAVRQALPKDDFAAAVVPLDPIAQRQALDGKAARKANGAILKPVDDDEKEQIAGLRSGFARMMRNMPSAQKNGIMEVAESIAARGLELRGELSEQMTGGMLARALDVALGSTGEGAEKRGGVGWWAGRMYLLPGGVRQRDFDGAVSRYLSGKSGAKPVNPDGSPANLRNATPVAIGGNRYQWFVGDRQIMNDQGKPFTLGVDPR
ncbi:hypothetical protein HT136_01440 [Novosphingobium profundi]|uniref:hypothetical protein n=1 Tax=Novosphingobium profundi TaxID=1774954 RepID=UPI001BD92DF7|nr:hypothetical protein [Novosphingobium profundi]MBT0667030.1 hypothetical protein [Novosphingobium profundi]